ncbi:hypothetical protein H7J93_14715 [Mycobacterium barrassiae]|uniref:hypothetical protein n=1 Tax=Mycobacterium barrassiae TaxID=319709 RepID=UPI002265927E|nr:hypothetical protein [Mycobacterium barrassiae]MCV7300876.1 hypothetical protein [Mycobacterium barrassiae]
MNDDPDSLVAEAEAFTRKFAEYRQRLLNLTGRDDPLWPLAMSIARQVLASGQVSAEELVALREQVIEREARDTE